VEETEVTLKKEEFRFDDDDADADGEAQCVGSKHLVPSRLFPSSTGSVSLSWLWLLLWLLLLTTDVVKQGKEDVPVLLRVLVLKH
jgi:hypothetical protein